jgi:hypothetical protein
LAAQEISKSVSDPNQSRERINQIYDTLTNIFAEQEILWSSTKRFRYYNFTIELLIAAGATGSGVAGFTVWQTGYGKYVWALP